MFPPQPLNGHVMVIGVDADVTLRSRYPKVDFWPGGINRAQDIPENTQAILINNRMTPGDIRLTEEFAKQRGVQIITRESSLVSIRERLSCYFDHEHAKTSISTVDTADTSSAPFQEPEKLTIDKLISDHANFGAKIVKDEITRLQNIAYAKNASFAFQSIYQRFLLMRKRKDGVPTLSRISRQNQAPAIDTIRPASLVSTIQALTDDVQTEYNRRRTVLAGLSGEIIRLEGEKLSLIQEIEQLRNRNKSLRDENDTLKSKAKEVEQLRKDREALNALRAEVEPLRRTMRTIQEAVKKTAGS